MQCHVNSALINHTQIDISGMYLKVCGVCMCEGVFVWRVCVVCGVCVYVRVCVCMCVWCVLVCVYGVRMCVYVRVCV